MPEQYFGNKKSLRYNRVFVPDGSRYSNYFFAQLVNGLFFMVAPDWNASGQPNPVLYALSYDNQNWIYFDINKLPNDCLSCELEKLGRLVAFKTIDTGIRFGIPLLKVAGGVVALASVAHTGGQSIPVYKAMTMGLVSLSASWAMVGGSIQLLLELTGDSDLASQIPTSFIEGTVGVVVLGVVNDEVKAVRINALLSMAEGVVMLNFDKISDLEAISNAITIIGFVDSTGKYVETLNN